MAANEKVIVDFAAESWCVPCQRLKPHYNAASEKADGVIWLHADVDINPDLMHEYPIMGVPTLYAYKDGEFVEEVPSNVRTAIALVNYATAL